MDYTQLVENIEQAAGKIEKAVIVIQPQKQGDVEEQPPVSPKQSSGIDSFKSGATELAKTAGKAALNAAAGVVGLQLDALTSFNDADKQPNTFYVQFNPASISFDASATMPKMKKDTGADAGKSSDAPPNRKNRVQAYIQANDVNIRMTVKLAFNDVNNDDAFLENRLSPVSGEAIQSVAKSAVKIAGFSKKYFSVRDQVQALTYMNRNSTVKKCYFMWGTTCIRGMIEGVDAKYTMFNTKGEPVHADVTLSLLLVNGYDDIKGWDDMYKEAFGSGEGYIRARDRGPVGDAFGKVGGFVNVSL